MEQSEYILSTIVILLLFAILGTIFFKCVFYVFKWISGLAKERKLKKINTPISPEKLERSRKETEYKIKMSTNSVKVASIFCLVLFILAFVLSGFDLDSVGYLIAFGLPAYVLVFLVVATFLRLDAEHSKKSHAELSKKFHAGYLKREDCQ